MTHALGILALLSCGFGATAAQPEPKNAGDRTQILRDIVIGPGDTANVVQCFACTVHVKGQVKGDIITIGGSIYVAGPVDGDALAVGGHIEAQPGGLLRGGAIAVGGYVTARDGGTIGGHALSFPYALLPGQYRPTAIGIFGLVAFNLLVVALAGMLLRGPRIENTARTIRNRKSSVLVTGAAALLIAWGFESLGQYLGRAEATADLLLGVLIAAVASAGATGLGRFVAGIAFPTMAAQRAALAGILALTLLELVPLLGFVVLTVGLLLALGAAIVSGFGARAVPSPASQIPA